MHPHAEVRRGPRGARPDLRLGFACQGATLSGWYGEGDELFDAWWRLGPRPADDLVPVLEEFAPDVVHSHNLPDELTVLALDVADGRRAGAVAARHGVPATDLASLLADPAVDAVAVAVPATRHVAVARQVLAAGRHALAEKPLALDVDGAAELGAAADRAGLVLMVSHLLRLPPRLRAAGRPGARSALGRLRHVAPRRIALGRGAVFTNDSTPRAEVVRSGEVRETRVERGAIIGANATIVCGHTVGAWSFVAAGATVTSDVAPHALVAGVPAQWPALPADRRRPPRGGTG